MELSQTINTVSNTIFPKYPTAIIIKQKNVDKFDRNKFEMFKLSSLIVSIVHDRNIFYYGRYKQYYRLITKY